MATYYNPYQDMQLFAIELHAHLKKLDVLNDYHLEKHDLNPITQNTQGIHYYQIKVVDKEKLAGFYLEMTTLIVKEDGVQFGRTLDGYTFLYTQDVDTPKKVAMGIIKKLRELSQVTQVF